MYHFFVSLPMAQVPQLLQKTKLVVQPKCGDCINLRIFGTEVAALGDGSEL